MFLHDSEHIPWTVPLSGGRCPCGSGRFARECCWKSNGRWGKNPAPIIRMKYQTGFRNKRCYLAGFGDCSRRTGREHFISRNILKRIAAPGTTLKFEDAPNWFGGKRSVEIGVDAFSSKVLCNEHNSALTDLDDAAGRAFSGIEALAYSLVDWQKRQLYTFQLPYEQTSQNQFHLASGIDLERWLIKVYCGLVAAGRVRAASGRTIPLTEIDEYLLHALIGSVTLCPPLGLYTPNAFIGQQLRATTFSLAPIQATDGSDEVGGLVFSLGMLNLVLVATQKFGEAFAGWRHPGPILNLNHGASKFGFLFTY